MYRERTTEEIVEARTERVSQLLRVGELFEDEMDQRVLERRRPLPPAASRLV